MKHIVHFAKILFVQTIVTAILLSIFYVALWLNPDCLDKVSCALTENFDIVGAAHRLVSEVKALLLN